MDHHQRPDSLSAMARQPFNDIEARVSEREALSRAEEGWPPTRNHHPHERQMAALQ